MMGAFVRTAVVVTVVLLALSYAGVEVCTGFGLLTPAGALFVPQTGEVTAVEPGSPAARAGLRAGDSVDFARASWTEHLWLNRGDLLWGRSARLPVLRHGRSLQVTLVPPPPGLRPGFMVHLVTVGTILFYVLAGLAVYARRRNVASFVFLLYAASTGVVAENTLILSIASPGWMPVAMLLCTVPVGLYAFCTLYFGLIFASERYHIKDALRFCLGPLVGFICVAYLIHFLGYALWAQLNIFYPISVTGTWIANLMSAVVITLRASREREGAVRLRWVAAAIWAQNIFLGAFFIEQNLTPDLIQNTAIDNLVVWFSPAFFGLAYALVRTHIVDVRIVGGKTLVLAALTALPIALFSIADWVFSRRLADARLATIVELAIAVVFGVFLNALHRRVEHFVARLFFASRHRAFTRMRHLIHALPSAHLSQTVYDALTKEVALALDLSSAAVFIENHDDFLRRAEFGWDGHTSRLSADDPLIWHARSSHHGIHLVEEFASEDNIPQGDSGPQIAFPISGRAGCIAVALYGAHLNGDRIDPEEEALLGDLAHVAGAALEHLASEEKLRGLQREIEALRPAPARG